MELIIVVLVGGPVVLAIWLIARSLQASQRIDELTRRLARLEREVLEVKERTVAPPRTAPAAESQPAAKPVPKPAPVHEPPPIPPGWELNLPGMTVPTAPVVPVAPPIASPPVIPSMRPKPELTQPMHAGAPPVQAAARQVNEASGETTGETTGAPPAGSFEMRLGTYWLVRAGIVMLLTGLVFFGNYAYHNFIGLLGPGGKISLLYLAGAALMGAGLWWQRRLEKESLRNYAEVLFAGGLAAVYFTTYAAHHIAQLCVIPSVTLDGVLLLAWAGFIAWIADRRKSEVLAMFAVGLAYYTGVITNVGAFTLYSNLLLTIVGLFFLVRHRWVGLSLGSLLATYASYAFWRFYQNGDWRWAEPGEGLWFGAGFLMSYWVLFTAAAFLSKSESLVSSRRAGFVTINNAALFSLFLLTMLQLHTGGFWKFALIYGGVLLGLSALARRQLAAEPLVANTYLTQGLLLVTMGLVARLAGLHLALVLAFESAVLLMLGTLQKSPVQVFGAYVTGAMAVGFGGQALSDGEPNGVWSGAALGTFMVVNAVWSHRQRRNPDAMLFRPEPAYFTLLALVAWFATTWFNTSLANFPLALALEAVGLTFSIYILAVPEIALAGQIFLLAAQLFWISRILGFGDNCHWWQPALIISISLGLSHWWQRQKTIVIRPSVTSLWQGLYGLAVVAVVYLWLQPLVSAPVWLALTSLLALLVTGYGVATRAWLLAACGQLLLLASAWQFASQLWEGKPDWWFPLAPVVALGLLSGCTVRWLIAPAYRDLKVREPLLVVAQIYRWLALVMSVSWVFAYLPDREWIWVFVALGLVVFLLAGWWRNREALCFGAVFTAVGLVLVWRPWWPSEQLAYLPNFLALLVFLGQQQIARHQPARYTIAPAVHTGTILAGGASLWWFLSRVVMHAGGGFYLTASWAALALILFVCGMILVERVYRWVGLGVLAGALGRVVLVDVWKQETIFRVLTFMALGLVLLVLGYIYNKYQDKIRRWL